MDKPLDPEPYVSQLGWRWSHFNTLSGDRFNPRPEYEQDRSKYPA